MLKKSIMAVLVVTAAAIILLTGAGQSKAMSYDFDSMWNPVHSSVLTLSFDLGAGVNFWVWNGDEENFKGFKLLGPGSGFAVFSILPSGGGYEVKRGSQSFFVEGNQFAFAFLDNAKQLLSPAGYEAEMTPEDADTYTITYAYNNGVNLVQIQDAAPAPVPIPAAMWLMGSGLVGLVGLRRR